MSHSVSLFPYLVIFTLYGVLSLVVTLGDVPSIPCAAVDYLKFSANISSAFKYFSLFPSRRPN